jgi:hypothetical protein
MYVCKAWHLATWKARTGKKIEAKEDTKTRKNPVQIQINGIEPDFFV